MEVAMVKRALDDGPHCGDECCVWESHDKTILCVVDGLGHGEQAEMVAKAAVDFVARHLSEALLDIFAGCSRALRDTRGVAMGIAVIDEEARTLTYAGVGNTRARILGARTIILNSTYGIVGAGYKTLSPETVHLAPGSLVILFTDGVAEAMDLSGYDETLRANPQWLAERIIQDWRRETDDAAMLVARNQVV